jgi:hypothetical protein
MNLQHRRVNVVAAAKLHVYLQRNFRSCVWASAAMVRNCNLAKRGENPVAAPQYDGSEFEYYNLGQLPYLSRTSTGTWFPMNFQRTLSSEMFIRKHHSTVWFLEQQLGNGIVPRPGQTPSQLTLNGQRQKLYNTDQLTQPPRAHIFSNGCSMKSDDALVLEYVARRRGFVSNVWSAARFVGVRCGVTSSAYIFDGRYGVLGMYNQDQLVWPIPVPDPPHCWANGSAMLPHEQLVLEQARISLGLTSRRWVVARSDVACNNLQPGAELTKLSSALPRAVMTVANVDQVINVPAAVPHM